MYMGTDGGVYISRDKGNTWSHCENLPVSQFYHVSVDMEKPYNIYGDYRITAAGKVLLKHQAVFRMPIGKLLVTAMDLMLMPTKPTTI